MYTKMEEYAKTTDNDIESATKAWIELQEKALLGDFLGEHQTT